MTELFDATQIPDDPGHWDALARRVAANASRESTVSAFGWLSQSRAGWVAASLMAAALLVATLYSSESSSARNRGAEWTQALAPVDEVGKAIALPDGPPAIGALLLRDRRGT
jgi:hypothetical protein